MMVDSTVLFTIIVPNILVAAVETFMFHHMPENGVQF